MLQRLYQIKRRQQQQKEYLERYLKKKNNAADTEKSTEAFKLTHY